MRRLLFGLAFGLVVFSTAAHANNGAGAILGTWLTNDSSVKVEIVNEHGVYNGHVVWLKAPLFPANAPNGMAGKPKVDRLNPDKSLRSRPIMGLTLLTGFHYAGGNVWDGGTLYAPTKGKSYRCKLTLAPDGRLKISIGGSIFGKTLFWTRTASVASAASPERSRQAAYKPLKD
ncbi:MAG: DUF2147 domain-containing protein [Gammaproteobacteria bacterium]